MKRSELVVGDELYHARLVDWRDGYTKTQPDSRVRVLSLDPYTVASYIRAPIRSSTGTGVLVEVLDEKTGAPRAFPWGTGYVVRLGHLRGPYAATVTAVAARRAARATIQDEESARRRALTDAVDATIDRARLDGWSSARSEASWGTIHPRNVRVSVSLADFERMLARLETLQVEARHEASLRELSIEP